MAEVWEIVQKLLAKTRENRLVWRRSDIPRTIIATLPGPYTAELRKGVSADGVASTLWFSLLDPEGNVVIELSARMPGLTTPEAQAHFQNLDDLFRTAQASLQRRDERLEDLSRQLDEM